MTKHAVVTGAASGIGADITCDLLGRGWTVYGLDLAHAAQQETGPIRQRQIDQDARCRYIPLVCDVSNAEDVSRAFRTIADDTSKVDALIGSAGVFRTGPLLDMHEADFDALFAVNTKGAWLVARAVLPLLLRAVQEDEPARIVFVASIAALRPKVGGGAYAASKVALTHMSRVLAVELAAQGILVNAVAPATVDTPMTQALENDAAINGYSLSGASPLGRVATPRDITAVVRFLLSPDANYVTGAVLPIDGGTSAAFQPK